jgi:hypothetical protein
MGITPLFADMLICEHKHRPLPRVVHLMGRQTIHFSHEVALQLMQARGVEPHDVTPELDTSTAGAQSDSSDFITDETFFKMLGVEEVRAIDVSNYEGADIIVNLNEPIEEKYENLCEFIYGGSVLDNIFNPVEYIRNVSRMLRIGGRLLEHNNFTMNYHPYVILPAYWYLDFFVINRFKDVKIYIADNCNVYFVSQNEYQKFFSNFGNPTGDDTNVIVLAEKGANASTDKIPNQDQYRPASEWKNFRGNLAHIDQSCRPVVRFSDPEPIDFARTPLKNANGYEFVGVFRPCEPSKFTKLDPSIGGEPSGIVVVEATYGLNTLFTSLPKPALTPVFRGNVTSRMAFMCNGKGEVDIEISANDLGDPAPEVGKDLTVTFYYTNDPERRLKNIYISAEAHGKRLCIPPFDPLQNL